jgi:hypothetical protein
MRNRILHHLDTSLRRLIDHGSKQYSSLSAAKQKTMLLVFGVATGMICLLLIVQALTFQAEPSKISIDTIATPNDAYMNNQDSTSTDQLIPVGKLKGEINGEFEAFYLAVDKDGRTYISRSLDISAKPWQKSERWEQISREQLNAYEKELHFLPIRTKGLKR